MCKSTRRVISVVSLWTRLRENVAYSSGGRECGEGFFEGGGVFDVEGGDGGVAAEDLAHEAGEDFAGAYFDEVGCALGDEELMHSTQRTGPVTWRMRAVAGVGGAGDEAGVDVGGYGDGGVVEGEGVEVGGEGVLRGLHEGAVEGGADLEHDGALGSGVLAEVGGAMDGGGCAGDDGLVGGVEVGGGD